MLLLWSLVSQCAYPVNVGVTQRQSYSAAPSHGVLCDGYDAMLATWSCLG